MTTSQRKEYMCRANDELRQRYGRQMLLDEIGEDGQRRIAEGRVLVVGAGGLGSPALMYLAAAGVGCIGVVDGDVVEVSNLHRQIIHSTPNLGRKKVESARERMLAINPNVEVECHYGLFTEANAGSLVGDYDFVVDATDNFAAKFLISDACVGAGKPFSHGGILRLEGQTFTHVPGTANLRDIFGAQPPEGFVPKASQAGVLGSVVGVIGCIQTTEVLKYLTGRGKLLTNQLLRFNAATMDFRKIRF